MADTSNPPIAELSTPEVAAASQGVAARLSLQLAALILALAAVFIGVAHQQRTALLDAQVREEVELVSALVRQGTQPLLSDGRTRQLDAVLNFTLRMDEVFAAFIWTDAGLLAGGAVDLPCLMASFPQGVPIQHQTGRADCGVGVRWSSTSMEAGGATLVMAIEEVFVRRALMAGLRRELLFAAIAAFACGLLITIALKRAIVRPLRLLGKSVRQLANADAMVPVRVGGAPREVVKLAAELNESAAEIAASRAALIAHSREQLALERRLAQAEKFAVIGRLSGGLAHELGSPLSVIGMRAQIIEERAGGVPAVRNEAVAISREVGRMTAFIEGLLHLTSEHGLVLEDVDVHLLASEVITDLAGRAQDADVVVRLESTAAEAVVRGQATLLRHALHNVVRNALHALTEHAGEKRIIIRVFADRDEVRIIVDDSGPGIPADEVEKVFEPFQTARKSGKGVGLGLPVSRGIIDEHGGRMLIDRGPEGGARVMIILPRDGMREGHAAVSLA